jgi:hypothetical protein
MKMWRSSSYLSLLLAAALCLVFNSSALAQDQNLRAQSSASSVQRSLSAQAQSDMAEVKQQARNNQSTTVASSTLPIMRLQDTIRANKEQPQVLTIVPWQLPVHQRIDEDKQWQLQVTPMAAIERNAFLKNLSVVKDIEASKSQ